MEESHVFEDTMQLVDWVLDGTPSVATAEHARHVIEIIEAGYRAAESGPAEAAKPVVSDFAHLFNSAPAGQRAYRGSGRPPKWLLALIEKEIAAGNAA